PPSSEQSHEFRLADGVAWENRPRIVDSQMAHGHLAEHVAEVGRDGEVPSFVPPLGSKAWPTPVDAAAADAAADDEHRVTMAVVGPAIAVLMHRPAELRHRHNHGVLHTVAEIRDERGEATREIVEPSRELSLRGTLVHVS